MNRFAWAIIAVGAALRLSGYLRGWSLWLDELLVAQNIIDRSFIGLMSQLENGQNAPIGWLWLIELSTRLFGESEWALRAWPLLASCLALPVMWAVSRRVLGPGAGLVALGIVAVGWANIAYAFQVKQYSTDVLAALLIVRAGLRLQSATRNPKPENGLPPPSRLRAGVMFALTGLVVMWFSHPAVFVLVGVGSALLVDRVRRRAWGEVACLSAIGAVWAAAFAVNYFNFMRLAADWEWGWLWDHWQREGGFWPWPPQTVGQWLWPMTALANLMNVTGWWGPPAWIALPVAVVGAGFLGRRQRTVALMLGLPLGLTFLAALLRKYPFADRLLLFATPAAAVFLAAGLACVCDLLRSAGHRSWAVSAPAVVLAIPVIIAVWWVGHGRQPATEHTRPLLRELTGAREPGEPIVLTWWAEPAWTYYAPRVGLGEVDPVVADRDDADAPAALAATLRDLPEDEAWVLLTHYAMHPDDLPDEFIAAVEPFGALRYQRIEPGAALMHFRRKPN